MENQDKFDYSYTAPTEEERKEILAIRNTYIPSDKVDTKLDLLRKLDNKVISRPKIISIIVGVIGTLVFGLGLSMILEWSIFVWGLVLSIVGAIIDCVAYPLYNVISKFYKKKYSNQIIELSDEILNKESK